ncbi:MAG TPA: PHP domain-containing protein [Candidatus Sulfopaludibacter sp.]|nr:PHP domain-containing protein [Candidatus Sulfopaludibacter sp.]
MPFISNQDIARLIQDVSAAYQVKSEYKSDSTNKFRIQKLNEMASNIMNLDQDLYYNYSDEKIPGIGKNTIEYLHELFETGKVNHYEEVKSGLSDLFFELSRIITPKQSMKIINYFKVKDISEVKELTEEDLEDLFPTRLSQQIITDLHSDISTKKLYLLPEMIDLSDELLEYIERDQSVIRCEVAGSIRRRKPIIKDIDIVVETLNLNKTRNHILKYSGIKEQNNEGKDWLMFKIKKNISVDCRIVSQSSNEYISLLHHLTGSKFHNIHLRELAKRMGYSISEHGILDKKNNLFKPRTEEEFFKFLKLKYIPPELREDSGYELSEELPKQLIELKDLKGDLHIHSSYNIQSSHDYGDSTIEDIAIKAYKLGYEYIGISDHNPKQSLTSDEMLEILKERKKIIDKAQNKIGIRIFNILEVDIRPDGTLAIADEVLNYLDFCIVSIHSSFDMDVNKMTSRIIKGLNHPKAKILGHPLTRILPEVRGEILLNWDKLFKFCAANNKYIEINSSPQRIDLPFNYVFEGLSYNCKYIINSDMHAIRSIDNVIWGIFNARRGWCEPRDIINTYDLYEFESIMKN